MIVSTILLVGTLALSDPPPEGQLLGIRDIVAGTWGWDVEGASCEDNPHTLEFSGNGKKMTLRYAKSLDENPPTEAVYKIVREGPGFIRMEKTGETEKTTDGKLVAWDLVLLGPSSYCWHRTDWQPGGCTQPAKRCGAEPTD